MLRTWCVTSALKSETRAHRNEGAFAYFITRPHRCRGWQRLMDYDRHPDMARSARWGGIGRRRSGRSFRSPSCARVRRRRFTRRGRTISARTCDPSPSESTITVDRRTGAIRRRAGVLRTLRLLKRPDEKYVTERAYDNPKFVEDMVRDVAARPQHRAAHAMPMCANPRTSSRSTIIRRTR